MLGFRRFAGFIAIAVILTACGGRGGNPSDSSPNVVPQALSVGSGTQSASGHQPAANILPSASTQLKPNNAQAVKLIGCPAGIWCVAQGQSLQMGPVNNPSSSNFGLLTVTDVSLPNGVTSTWSPNPMSYPYTSIQTVTIASTVPVGPIRIGNYVTSSAYGTSSGITYNNIIICDGKTGYCTPPPPVPGKSKYKADRTAHVVIPLTDAAAAGLGGLTWKVTGTPSSFANIKFSKSTTSVPHKNSLVFDVAVDAIPATYTLDISVKNASGLTSPVSHVTVTVPHIVGFYTIINSDKVFETDANKNVIVSNGSQYVATGPILVADFPGTSSDITIASNARATQSSSELPSWFDINRLYAQCIGIGHPVDNQDGKTPLTFNFSVECVRGQVNSFNVNAVSSVVKNYDQLLPDLPKQNVPCENPVTNGLVFTCSAKNVVIKTYTNQATSIMLSMSFDYVNDSSDEKTPPGHFFVNAKGVAYPRINVDGGHGDEVPFPDILNPLANCPNGTPNSATCPRSNTNALRRATIKYYPTQGWAVPAGITATSSGKVYQTHHILPTACGGGNEAGNGLFLTSTQHLPYTRWWRYVPPCAPMGPTD